MEFHELANVVDDFLYGIAMFPVMWGFRCCHSCGKSWCQSGLVVFHVGCTMHLKSTKWTFKIAILMISRALLIHGLGHGQLCHQKSCVLSDWQPLLVVNLVHSAILALAELSTVTWQNWQCAGMPLCDANLVVVEVILDPAVSWYWYSTLETKVHKWAIDILLQLSIYPAIVEAKILRIHA